MADSLLMARMEITAEGLVESLPRFAPALLAADALEARRRKLEAAHGGPLPESPGLAAMEAGLRSLPITDALLVVPDVALAALSRDLAAAADLALDAAEKRAAGSGGGTDAPTTELDDARALLVRLRGGFVRALELPGSVALTASELDQIRIGIDELNGTETEDSARVAIALRAVTYLPAMMGLGFVPDGHLARRARVLLMACRVVLEASLTEVVNSPTRAPAVH